MADTAQLERDLIYLESKLSHQDKLVQELNDVVYDQGRQLAALAARLERLEAILRERPDAIDPSQEPPPHY